MKPDENHLRSLDDSQLDMLVDGQLSESERRELLTRLDRTPNGWKRCALAFLEAQCWREAMGRGRQPAAAAMPAPARRPASGISGNTLFAMAASFLVALGLGVYARGLFPAGGEPPVPATGVAQSADSAAGPSHAVPPTADPGPWQMVTLPVAAATQGQPIQLPCREGGPAGDDWANVPPALSPDLLDALRKAGHQISEQRQVIPLEMKDGRRVMVPVDQVELRYVGGRAFQ
jgi:hypothetical protein